MPALLLKHWKALAVLLLCLASFAAGRWGMPTPTTTDKVQDKTAETQQLHETQQDLNIVQNNKITTITKKRDGSVVTTIVDHTKILDNTKKVENSTDQKTEKKVETTTTTASSPYDVPRYSFSLSAQNDLALKWNPDYQAQVGYRLIGPLWGDLSYDITTHKPGVGLTLTFP